jgi:hypothetical protein
MSFKSTAHQSALTDIEENFLKAFGLIMLIRGSGLLSLM